MATTVNSAFKEFLDETVNLDPSVCNAARKSRDWLLKQIHRMPETYDDFPRLSSKKDIAFGSFARRTKSNPLDDIDLISCMDERGTSYTEYNTGRVRITVDSQSRLSSMCHGSGRSLNSKRVINRYIKYLSKIGQYQSAPIMRRGEAAVIKLTSYPWNFDIVPGFYTQPDHNGRNYYLIPDGRGHWQKTDPVIDRDRISRINQGNQGYLLNTIRIMKYWNRRKTMPSVPSYMLECLISDFYDGGDVKAEQWIDLNILDVLEHLETAILKPVIDPKGILPNLNTLTREEKTKISHRAKSDFNKAQMASSLEDRDMQRASINRWRELFGRDFPGFG